jgi:hypothetical protein
MAAEGNIQLVETFDEIKMLSARPVTNEQQALVNQIFSQISNDNADEQITKLKAERKTSELFIRHYLLLQHRTKFL